MRAVRPTLCTNALGSCNKQAAIKQLVGWEGGQRHTGRLNTCCQGSQSLHAAGLWWVELHNPVHVWDVQAPCSHVCAQQHTCSNAKGASAAVSSACIEWRRRILSANNTLYCLPNTSVPTGKKLLARRCLCKSRQRGSAGRLLHFAVQSVH